MALTRWLGMLFLALGIGTSPATVVAMPFAVKAANPFHVAERDGPSAHQHRVELAGDNADHAMHGAPLPDGGTGPAHNYPLCCVGSSCMSIGLPVATLLPAIAATLAVPEPASDRPITPIEAPNPPPPRS